MGHYADSAIYGRDGQPKLLVEAKNKRGTSREWAARLRRNMYAHGGLPQVPYFLLALPDKFYLWRGLQNPFDPVEPQYSADSRPVLDPYFKRSGISGSEVTERGLELAVSAWLEKLVRGHESAKSPESSWIRSSGLADAVRDGRVEVQALV